MYSWLRMTQGSAALVATPSARARAVLHKGGYTVLAKLVLTVTAQNKPGELERICKRLARAGVNVNYVYGSTPRGDGSTLVFGVSDVDRALKAVGG